MMNKTQLTTYRRALAWIGFAATFAAIPALVVATVYLLTRPSVTVYDRATFQQDFEATYPFYQQAPPPLSLNTNTL
jgi:hypothetical protein